MVGLLNNWVVKGIVFQLVDSALELMSVAMNALRGCSHFLWRSRSVEHFKPKLSLSFHQHFGAPLPILSQSRCLLLIRVGVDNQGQPQFVDVFHWGKTPSSGSDRLPCAPSTQELSGIGLPWSDLPPLYGDHLQEFQKEIWTLTGINESSTKLTGAIDETLLLYSGSRIRI